MRLTLLIVVLILRVSIDANAAEPSIGCDCSELDLIPNVQANCQAFSCPGTDLDTNGQFCCVIGIPINSNAPWLVAAGGVLLCFLFVAEWRLRKPKT